MKKIIVMVLLSLMFLGCNSQKSKAAETESETVVSDTTKPQVKIKVNKKYDDEGNLVQYDSTYSYFYSSPGGNMNQLNSDSFYSQFRSMFHSKYDDWFDDNFEPMFYSDSLFKYDFLNNDYFYKRFELNRPMFHDLFKEMDSLKTDMLHHHFPNGIMKPKQ